VIKTSFVKIASYNAKEVGWTEEDVKVRVTVPLLECLGHDRTQLDFEWYGIDIFIKDLPSDSRVILEIKRQRVNLDKHIGYLRNQAEKADALLAVITNGAEIRVYFNGFVYEPLCKIRREDLAKDEAVGFLKQFLSRENLTTGRTKAYVAQELKRMWEEGVRKLKVVELWMEEVKSGRVSEETNKKLLQEGVDSIQHFMDKLGAFITSYKKWLQRLEPDEQERLLSTM